jgi:hypothetical protein
MFVVDMEAFTSHNDGLPPPEDTYFTLRMAGTAAALFGCVLASVTAATIRQLVIRQVATFCLALAMALAYANTSGLHRRGKLWLGASYCAVFAGFATLCHFIALLQIGDREFHEPGGHMPPDAITFPISMFAVAGCIFFGYAATRLANIVA